MDRIGVVGLNWRRGGPSTLSEFSLPVEARAAAVVELAQAIGTEELVYLGTCNRVEVAFVTAAGVPVSEYRRRIFAALRGAAAAPGEAERWLRAWQGEGAAEHVFLVTLGLDSARLGETEVSGQVRAALEMSRELGLAGTRLDLLFDEALKMSKRARNETTLGLGRSSLAEIGLDEVRAQAQRTPGRIALVGISPMTERCARSLIKEGSEVLIVNRTSARARELARELGARASYQSLEEFRRAPEPVVAVISATAADGYVLGERELRLLQSVGAQLFVDFATAPDIDPRAAAELNLPRFGMEEILAVAENNREERLNESGAARDIVDRALESLATRFAKRNADHAISALHESYLSTSRLQVEKLLQTHFANLDPERCDLLRRFTEGLARHFAHLPQSGLREIALAHGPQAVQQFFAHAGDDLMQRLKTPISTTELFAGISEDLDA